MHNTWLIYVYVIVKMIFFLLLQWHRLYKRANKTTLFVCKPNVAIRINASQMPRRWQLMTNEALSPRYAREFRSLPWCHLIVMAQVTAHCQRNFSLISFLYFVFKKFLARSLKIQSFNKYFKYLVKRGGVSKHLQSIQTGIFMCGSSEKQEISASKACLL